jgi:4-hydroxy-tetrahydrodipicolinate reductase
MPQRDRREDGNVIVVCVAGATGWTGRAVAQAVDSSSDLTLGGAVARSAAGLDLGEVWGIDPNGVMLTDDVESALTGVDVLVEYTSPSAAKRHAMLAIERGIHVVIGTSGLTAADFTDIDAAAREARVGVVAAGNFSLTAAMAQAAALLVARFLPQREIVDYASANKPDAPSGTARELADRLASVSMHELAIPVDQTVGNPEARGTAIGGTQVHSVRLPSYVVSTEIVFAQPDERLTIRHDAGNSPVPYVAGTLLAVRAVGQIVGLIRGLDALLLRA